MIPKVPSVKSRITAVKGRLAKHLLGHREGASCCIRNAIGWCKVLMCCEVDALKNAKTVLFQGPALRRAVWNHTPGGTKLRCVRADKTEVEAQVLVVGHKDTLEVCEEQLSNIALQPWN